MILRLSAAISPARLMVLQDGRSDSAQIVCRKHLLTPAGRGQPSAVLLSFIERLSGIGRHSPHPSARDRHHHFAGGGACFHDTVSLSDFLEG